MLDLDLDKAINAGTKDAIAFDMRGYCRYENKNFDAAIKDFDEAVTKDPKLALAFYHRGDARFSVNNLAGAVQDYSQAITLGLTDPVLYNNRGKAYFKQENYPSAISDFSNAITKRPDYSKAYENRGNAYYATKKYEEAIRDFREVEKLTEKPDPELYRMLGNCILRLEKYPPARDYYDKLIAAGIKDKEVFFKRGMMQLEEEEYQAALSDFDNAQKAGENSVSVVPQQRTCIPRVRRHEVGRHRT